MPNRKFSCQPAGRSKAMLLPMGRDRASDLILRTRLFLERALRGDIDRGLINHLGQVCLISGYIARTGHSRIPTEQFERVEQELAQTLLAFEESGTCEALSAPLLAGLMEVVNEYDRMLGAVRLDIFAKTSDYLDHLMTIAASGNAGDPGAVLRAAQGASTPQATV